jgi:MoaA/NifB/PqqE/SkfB family radical SAM enzyme
MSRRNAGSLVAGREVVQLFRVSDDELAFVCPVLATFQRRNAGMLTVSLHRMPAGFVPSAPPAAEERPFGPWRRLVAAARARLAAPDRPVTLGPLLATRTLPCAELMDCEALDFATEGFTVTPGEILALCVSTRNLRGGRSPTLWLTDQESEGRIPGHVATYIGMEAQGAFGVQAQVTYGGVVAKTRVPRMILYSPVTQCNLNCIHCISAHTRTSVNKLSPEVKARMKEWSAAGELETISSDYSGDILWADSRFGGELDFITDLDIPFHIDTNGVCLTPEVSARLCGTRIASLNISLDAARDETVKRVRKGAPPLGEVTANIAALMRAREAAGATFPVSMSFTLMRSTLAEWPEFVRMAAGLGVGLVISRHLEAFTADMEAESLWHDQAAFNAARPEIEALAAELGIVVTIPPPFAGVARGGRKLCPKPWSSAVVLGSGDVAACCVPGLVMGNLGENSMEEIWNGKRYRELRATVNSTNPPPSCAACPMFRHTDNPDSCLIHSALERMKA